MSTMENPRIVTEAEWIEARKKLLVKEKELTRQRDAVAAERQKLPWVKIEKKYVFDTAGARRHSRSSSAERAN